MRTGIGVILTVCSFVVGFATPFFAPKERPMPVTTVEYRLPLRVDDEADTTAVTASPPTTEREDGSAERELDGSYDEKRARTVEEIQRIQHLLVEDAKLIVAARRSGRTGNFMAQASRVESGTAEAKKTNLKLLQSTSYWLNAHGQDIFPNITRALRKARSSVELLDKSAKAAAKGDASASQRYYKSAKSAIAQAKRIAARKTIGNPTEWSIEAE